jgi:hypothetical protein
MMSCRLRPCALVLPSTASPHWLNTRRWACEDTESGHIDRLRPISVCQVFAYSALLGLFGPLTWHMAQHLAWPGLGQGRPAVMAATHVAPISSAFI